MTPLYLSPSEAVVLRHALMSYRNHIAERRLDPPMTDGFELVAADTLVARLDMISEGLLHMDRQRSEKGADWQEKAFDPGRPEGDESIAVHLHPADSCQDGCPNSQKRQIRA